MLCLFPPAFALQREPGEHNESHAEQRIQEQHLAAGPQRRYDRERQAHALIVPDAVAIAGANLEMIVPSRQIGVSRVVLRAGLDPVLIEPLQPIAELVALGRRIVECGELDADDALGLRDAQSIGRRLEQCGVAPATAT